MSLELRIAALEARVAVLEAGRTAPAAASGSGSSSDRNKQEPIDDSFLDNEWANKAIRRDPKQWAGETQVGKTYSEAPAKWLLIQASALEYGAKMDKEKRACGEAVRLQEKGKNAGKPWYEANEFEARILRGWARRNEANPPMQRAAPVAASSYEEQAAPPVGDDDIPF